jgi:hypothetical protein
MRSLKIVGMLLCAVVMVAMASAGTKSMGIRDVYHLTFASAVHVGNAVLPAGDYTIRHEMEGQDHYMIFHTKKASDIKVKCTLVQLEHRALRTETVFTLNASNERVLEAFTFKGDTSKHVF